MPNDINDLRSELFETIRQLRDPNSNMDIARAKAVSEVAQTIINSAKVEVDMINAVGANRLAPSKFIGASPEAGADKPNQAPRRITSTGMPPRGPSGTL